MYQHLPQCRCVLGSQLTQFTKGLFYGAEYKHGCWCSLNFFLNWNHYHTSSPHSNAQLQTNLLKWNIFSNLSETVNICSFTWGSRIAHTHLKAVLTLALGGSGDKSGGLYNILAWVQIMSLSILNIGRLAFIPTGALRSGAHRGGSVCWTVPGNLKA